MENVTLRLHDDLRKAAEKRAAEAHWSLAEELRFALQMHYQKKTQLVTVNVLEERLRVHEKEFHHTDIQSFVTEVTDASGKLNEEPSSRVQVLEVLSRLQSRLDAGEEPTPSQIGEDLDIDCRTIGRILKHLGIEARHTTINRVPGRYYTKDQRPLVEMTYSRLSLDQDRVKGSSKTIGHPISSVSCLYSWQQ